MREIKFRAWNKKNAIMVPVLELTLGADWIVNEKFSCFDGETILMQYTGLKDKNGKEIWEGDIVRCTDKYEKEYYYKVSWVNHMAGFFYTDDTCKEDEWMEHVGLYEYEEVIGNIYENSELLEGKEMNMPNNQSLSNNYKELE